MDYSVLPHVNALLNTTSGLLLVSGYFSIIRRRINLHRALMVTAFVTSTLFLVSYVTYHLHHPSTSFSGQGIVRPFYFIILVSHIILAIVIVPLAVLTLTRALRGQFSKHRRIAQWTLPLWLYVSVTGVIIYLMLYRFYPAQ